MTTRSICDNRSCRSFLTTLFDSRYRDDWVGSVEPEVCVDGGVEADVGGAGATAAGLLRFHNHPPRSRTTAMPDTVTGQLMSGTTEELLLSGVAEAVDPTGGCAEVLVG